MSLIAAHVLLYDVQKWILPMLENCGPHVDRIYAAYSKKPWTYNPEAYKLYDNTFDISLLQQSPYYDKIELVEDYWETEEDTRNTCLKKARQDGMDFFIIQDADEFYMEEDYKKLIQGMEANPEHDHYWSPWYSFWRSWDYILTSPSGSLIAGSPQVGINCHRGSTFAKRRQISGGHTDLDALCYHGSMVLTDEEVYRKINTWGHAHEFDRDKWYQEKWLTWTEEVEDLHPLHPPTWKRAIPFNGLLPEVLSV